MFQAMTQCLEAIILIPYAAAHLLMGQHKNKIPVLCEVS